MTLTSQAALSPDIRACSGYLEIWHLLCSMNMDNMQLKRWSDIAQKAIQRMAPVRLFKENSISSTL